jgi:hypothetical protein
MERFRFRPLFRRMQASRMLAMLEREYHLDSKIRGERLR